MNTLNIKNIKNGNGTIEFENHTLNCYFVNLYYKKEDWIPGVAGELNISIIGKDALSIKLKVSENGDCSKYQEAGIKRRYSLLLNILQTKKKEL